MLSNKVAIFYYVSMNKLLEHDIFKFKELKRWLGENTMLTTHEWTNDNTGVERSTLKTFRKYYV